MPEPATLLLFAATAVALVAIPGPDIVSIVARTVDGGRRAGVAPEPEAPPPASPPRRIFASDLLYALGAGAVSGRLRGRARLARGRRHLTGGADLAPAVVALTGERRRA